MSVNFQEIPIIVTYYTNSKILCQKEFGSFAHFGSILNYFERYLKQSDQLQLKPKYILDDRKIEDNDLLMNLIQIPEKSKIIINANLLIEIDEKSNITEKNYPCYTKILQPKLNPFGLYILNPKEGSLSSKQFLAQIGVDKEKENENELNKININSAYCNSNKDLFISGGIYSQNEINNFWIINNESFAIKNIHMPFNKSDHSMIYINHNDEEFVFIAGGNDLKTFYYEIKSKRFSKWGNMNYAHIRPALIYIDNYIYCFDTSSNKNETTFERTNLDDFSYKWEKIVPIYENEKNKNLVNKGFGVVSCGGGKVMLCGGDVINMNPYLYDIEKNLLYTNDNCDDILFTFSDKNFYKINNNSYIALSSSLDEENEILIVDKNKYTLSTININSKEGKSKLKNIDDNFHKIKDSLFDNVHIELKTKDIIPENKKNKEIENQIDNNDNNDKFNDDNISYFESKPKEKNHKNKIFDEINENNFENKIEDNKYILNNHNFINYKKERNLENDYNYNDIDNNNSFEDDFEEEKKYKCKKKIEIKLNYDDDEGIYEVEGNNFIFDSNQKKFNDIKNNDEKFNIKNPQKNNDYNNNIINNIEEDKNEKNLDNKKDGNFMELEGKEDDKDENDQINIIEEDNNNPQNNYLDYSEEKIEENNENNDKEESNEKNNLNNNDNDNDGDDNNNKEKDIKENDEQSNDEPKEEHLEKNEEQNPNEVEIDQNEVNYVQNEGEENDQNDEKNFDQINIEKKDDQDIEYDNEEKNEQSIEQFNEDNIEGYAFDEEEQINYDEEIENYEGEKISENNGEDDGAFIENGDTNVNQGENGDIEENKDEIDQNNYIEHEENNLEENNEENNNNGGEHEEYEEQQDYYEPQERDKFQQTIVQPIGEDIIQIDNNPSHFYYDENNFCDYDIKHNDIEF